MTHLSLRTTATRILGVLSLSAVLAATNGCSMGTLQLSGPATAHTQTLQMSGRVHGGQQPVSFSTIALYAVGNSASSTYGTGATNLLTGTGPYYPGGATGCSTTADAITAYSVTSNVVTITAANTLIVGQLVTIAGLSSGTFLNGMTLTVTGSSAVSFTASVTNPDTPTTVDTGTATPTCYSTIVTDYTGSFSITGDYSCTGNPMVYLTATGGNPGLTPNTTNNSAIKLTAALGSCSTLAANTPFVSADEVTTAAMAYALGQYFTTTLGSSSTDAFGAPNTTQAQLGVANAFATANLLASTINGLPNGVSTVTGAGATLSVVPETAKLYTLANILASCVNSASNTSSNCAKLFGATAPSTGNAPTDILQAAVELSLNPTSTNSNGSSANLTTLFALQPSTGAAFNGGLTTQPTDWTLGVQYQDNAGTFFLKPQNIAVDSLGNVWVLSNNGGVGNLVQLGPTGTPLSNIAQLNEYGPFATPIANPPVLASPKTTTTTIATQNTVFTTTFGSVSNNPSINPRNLAIDPSNNVWFTQSSGASSSSGGSNGTTTIPVSGNLFEVATSATTGIPTGSTYGFATGKSAYGLTIDASGNVFIGEQSSSAYFGLFEFAYNSTPGNAFLSPIGFPPNATTTIVPEYISIDKSGNKLFTSGVATVTSAYEITGANASTCASQTANTLCQATGSAYVNLALPAGSTGPFGVAEGTTGTWVANNAAAASSLSLIPFGATASTTSTTYGGPNYFVQPKFPAVDGLGNVWAGNAAGPGTSATTGGSVSALSSTGAFLSPSNGGSTTIAPGFTHLGLNFGAGTAIDPSGNVWVANNAAWTAACSNPLTNTGNTCSSVFELVGAAAPVVTPIASQTNTGPTRP